MLTVFVSFEMVSNAVVRTLVPEMDKIVKWMIYINF